MTSNFITFSRYRSDEIESEAKIPNVRVSALAGTVTHQLEPDDQSELSTYAKTPCRKK